VRLRGRIPNPPDGLSAENVLKALRLGVNAQGWPRLLSDDPFDCIALGLCAAIPCAASEVSVLDDYVSDLRARIRGGKLLENTRSEVKEQKRVSFCTGRPVLTATLSKICHFGHLPLQTFRAR
jgi:hypothetical protein